MKKHLLLIYFASLIYADFIPYISPGVQIGINSNGNFFFSMQITVGIMPNLEAAPIALGATIGKRYYYSRKTGRFDRYGYIDGQLSLLFFGFGVGSIGKRTESIFYNDSGMIQKKITHEKYKKFKLWVGPIGLLSYDYITSPGGRHNFGLFGVAPIPIGDLNH